jgi:hypothetical protein
VGVLLTTTLAEWTGLEPATSGVTGQHSNRLNYHSAEPGMIQSDAACRNRARIDTARPAEFNGWFCIGGC